MTPATPMDPRYRSLDLWRGLACLMVVVDHTAMGAIPRLQMNAAGSTLEWVLRWLVVRSTELALGPPLFFVISGYCIAASVDSLCRKGKPAGEFLVRRLWRTFPPYWAAMLGLALLVVLLDRAGLERLHNGRVGLELAAPSTFTHAQWLGNLGLVETWRRHVVPGDAPVIFTRVAWSLCYQEQFYALCFVVALLAPRRLHRMLAALTVLVVLYRVFAWDSGGLAAMDGLFPIYWHEFAVGLAVYWRLNTLGGRARQAIDAVLVFLAVVGLVEGFWSTTVAAGFGLLLIGLRPYDGRLAELSWLAGVRACGRRCYSIYLVHLPVCTVLASVLFDCGLQGFWAGTLVALPVVSLAGVAAGWGFYGLVERRFLEPPRLSGARTRGSATEPAAWPGRLPLAPT